MPLAIGKYKKVTDIMKDELRGKTMTEFVTWMAKMHAYRNLGKKLKDKHFKYTKRCVVKKNLTFDNYKTFCLTVKQYTENKCYLKIRNTVYTGNKHKIV